jgi:hypothetical protein
MNRKTQYWIGIFILLMLFIAWCKVACKHTPVPVPLPAPNSLVMTAVEAKLTKQAIELVRTDVIEGRIPSTDVALKALSAILPRAVKDRVMKELGNPDISFMRDALDILESKIEGRAER